MSISREDAASIVKSVLEVDTTERYEVFIWAKDWRVRCYVKDLGCSTSCAQDRGFFALDRDGSPFYDGLKDIRVKEIIGRALEGIEIEASVSFIPK